MRRKKQHRTAETRRRYCCLPIKMPRAATKYYFGKQKLFLPVPLRMLSCPWVQLLFSSFVSPVTAQTIRILRLSPTSDKPVYFVILILVTQNLLTNFSDLHQTKARINAASHAPLSFRGLPFIDPYSDVYCSICFPEARCRLRQFCFYFSHPGIGIHDNRITAPIGSPSDMMEIRTWEAYFLSGTLLQEWISLIIRRLNQVLIFSITFRLPDLAFSRNS